MQKLRLLLLTLSHFCVDSYATLLAPLLPLLRANLELSLAQTGFLGTIVSICNISQPLMGIWADRMARRWLVVGGLALTTIFAPLMGIAPNYLSLVGILAMGGIGVAAFHPQVFSLAGELSAPRRSFGLALFIFGGTLGLFGGTGVGTGGDGGGGVGDGAGDGGLDRLPQAREGG